MKKIILLFIFIIGIFTAKAQKQFFEFDTLCQNKKYTAVQIRIFPSFRVQILIIKNNKKTYFDMPYGVEYQKEYSNDSILVVTHTNGTGPGHIAQSFIITDDTIKVYHFYDVFNYNHKYHWLVRRDYHNLHKINVVNYTNNKIVFSRIVEKENTYDNTFSVVNDYIFKDDTLVLVFDTDPELRKIRPDYFQTKDFYKFKISD